MCSKHVEAWNKLIIKFNASNWLIIINKYFLCCSAPRRFKLFQQHGNSKCTKLHIGLCVLLPAEAIFQYRRHQVGVVISCERGQKVTGVCSESCGFYSFPTNAGKEWRKAFSSEKIPLLLSVSGGSRKNTKVFCARVGLCHFVAAVRSTPERGSPYMAAHTRVCCKLSCKHTMNCMIIRVILLTSSDATS